MLFSPHSPIKTTSSAYIRWVNTGPLFGRLIPEMLPIEAAFFIKPDKASIAIMKINGDNASP
ncbi:hypothetical protein HanIR_Chr09g0443001 [Helianthus annuus]|nr:hypothetical protein HanIR_Chr09g0443001 [Helianthus annuus]